MTTEDPFEKAVNGRYPLANGISAAKHWLPQDSSVPRPDKTLGWLRIMSAFGMDHLYLRSPITGVLKLLSLGALLVSLISPGAYKLLALVAGLWYVWDNAQVWTEGERVVRYGMSLPFDLQTGIGQGMITDGVTHYEQRKNFSTWAVFSLFGFLGVDALVGKPALFIRKFVDFASFAGYASAIVACGVWTSPTAWNILYFVFLLICAAAYGLFVGVPWFASVNAVLNPEHMMTKGIKVDDDTRQLLNYFNSWTNGIGPKTQLRVEREFGFGNVSAEELRRDFAIEYTNAEAKEKAAKDTSKDKPAAGAKPVEGATWMWSLLLGNLFTGSIVSGVLSIPTPSIKMAKAGLEAIMAKAECARDANHANPTDPNAATGAYVKCEGLEMARIFASAVPGGQLLQQATAMAGPALERAKEVAQQVASVRDQVQGAVASAASVRDQVASVGAKVASVGDQVASVRDQVTQQVSSVAAATKPIATAVQQATAAVAANPLATAAQQAASQAGGSRDLSNESLVLGAVTAALIAGGAIKAVIDSVVV